MPLCASVNAKLPDGRWLYVSLVVGQNSDIKRKRLGNVELWNVTAGYKDESFAFPRLEEALTKLEEFMKVDAGSIGLYYAAAKGAGAVCGWLDGLLCRAFSVAKRVRSETGIGHMAVSVS